MRPMTLISSAVAEEMTAATEAEEGAIAYEWYRSGETVHLFDWFEDSAGAMTHLDNFDAQVADRFFDLFEATGWNIYGPASDALQQRIEPMGAVFYEKVEGFAR
jgi:hypothetical protein